MTNNASEEKTEKQSLVIATTNQGKLRELEHLLPKRFTMHRLDEFTSCQVAENGKSFVENALIKARFATKASNLPAIADDSGLCVNSLGGAPGIYSARYCEYDFNHATHYMVDQRISIDENNNQKLLQALAGNKRQRQAYFYCALVYVENEFDPTPIIATAKWHGTIGRKPRGHNGFGYDPLFVVDDYLKEGLSCTAALLSDSEKRKISHRGQAARLLATQLLSINQD